MVKTDVDLNFPHQDRIAFRDIIRFVEGKTNFSARLIEKDYYCSLVLKSLSHVNSDLVFKGGTLLNKVHSGFYRLSEDLDFTISTSPDGPRSERSQKAKPFKSIVDELSSKISHIQIEQPLKGSNLSMQYNAIIGYESVLIEKIETISVEISLRERVYEPVLKKAATLIEDPYTNKPLVPLFEVKCLSKGEAYAEKVRAALTRKDAAIRDLFDLDHAIREKHIPLRDEKWLAMVHKKIGVPGNGKVQLSNERRKSFEVQLETQLRPVLRERDYAAFGFARAWDSLEKLAKLVMEKK